MSLPPSDSLPILQPFRRRLFLESELVLGIWDAFPVSDGHALLVPRRHVASWFDATAGRTPRPDGGHRRPRGRHPSARTAGRLQHRRQRRRGGRADGLPPARSRHSAIRRRRARSARRGSPRHPGPRQLPGCQDDRRAARTSLVTGGDDPLLPHIISHLAAADRADIVVSFALESGVDRVFEHFRDLLGQGRAAANPDRRLSRHHRAERADAAPRSRRQRRAARVRNRQHRSRAASAPVVRSFPPEGLHLQRDGAAARRSSAARTSARPR